MIQPITKKIVLSSIPSHKLDNFRLDTADGRFSLADQLCADIDEWCANAFDDGPRNHLGASKIGEECVRGLWYSFRWWKHKKHSGRMQRLFQDGHWYEERFIEMLRGIGCKFIQVDEASGKQLGMSDVNGHFGGSCDGNMFVASRYAGKNFSVETKFLAEFKTINEKGYAKFHDVKESKPTYWAQICTYGFKLGIKYALFFIVNKNTSNLCIEIVELDHDFGKFLIDKAAFIINQPVPPERITDNSSDFRCKQCDYHGVCHLGILADSNCRTCQYSQPVENAQWYCHQWKAIIPNREAMLSGCQAHTLIKS